MTKIEWTEKTWNPVTGCTKHSAGCDNCYAEKMHKRLTAMGVKKYAEPFETVVFHSDELLKPFGWNMARKVFVNSMSDLFHPDLEFDLIDRVFAVMSLCKGHVFQVLTKRPDAMRAYLTSADRQWRIVDAVHSDHTGHPKKEPSLLTRHCHDNRWTWLGDGKEILPLPNVWLGTSVESGSYTKRIDILRKVPAAVRFISFEPLIGRVGKINLDGIHWVIVGGESGPNARPMHPDWAREIRDQCVAANVPFFFKQWGEWAKSNLSDRSKKNSKVKYVSLDGAVFGKFPGIGVDSISMIKVGKKKAGSLLDGREWNEYPNE